MLKADKISFVQANLETADLAAFGTFDAIFCCGLLYHLPEPWKLVQQFTTVSPRPFLSTYYSLESQANTTINRYRGRYVAKAERMKPLSGLSPKSF